MTSTDDLHLRDVAHPAKTVEMAKATAQSGSSKFVLHAVKLSKSFAAGTNRVLVDFSCSIASGDLIYITGPNGVGKTVLARCLSGLLETDSGSIVINDEVFVRLDRKTARARGIEYLPQQLPRPSNLTGLELLALSMQSAGFLYWPSRIRHAAQLASEKYAIRLDIDRLARQLSSLSPAELQRVYLLRALLSGARLLILDEPTAGLTESDAKSLVSTLEGLTSVRTAPDPPAVMLIAHPLQVALDRTRVLTMTPSALVSSEGDTEANATFHSERIPAAPTWKEGVIQLSPKQSLRLAPGRIITVVGDASREFFHLFRLTEEEIVKFSRNAGLNARFIPFQGVDVGIAPGRPVFENCLIHHWDTWKSDLGFISRERVRIEFANEIVSALAVTPSDVDMPAGRLSGGNQQKLLIGRELHGSVDVLLAGDLFRGLATDNVSRVVDLVYRKATDGTCVVLFSVTPLLEESISDEVWRFEAGSLHCHVGATS